VAAKMAGRIVADQVPYHRYRTVRYGSVTQGARVAEVGAADAKVRQIRQAAKTLFLRHGFAGVSTATLAKAAGVSKETLYSRYGSKEAVFADVLEYLIGHGPNPPWVIPVLQTSADLERALRLFCADLSDRLMQRDYLELARIVIAETPRLPHLGGIFRRAVPRRALESAEALLVAARDAGLIADIDTVAAARMVVGPLVIQVLINGLLVAPSEADPGASGALDINGHLRLLLRVLSTTDSVGL
jgi:TetR/AcrR family transcriptional regulator, mexJK operon transcriptional repressor